MIAADFVLISILTVLISIYGDLFVSVASVSAAVKDSGSLVPGHGGVLDRIDQFDCCPYHFFYGLYLSLYNRLSE